MSSLEMTRNEIIAVSRRPIKPSLLLFFAFLALSGAAVFVSGIFGPQSQRIWQVYLINYVFWTGLAAGCVLFSAILSITHAHWGRPLKRLAEAPGFFLPVSLVLFAVLYPGRNEIFPWIANPVPEKAAWLNVSFLFLRDGVGLFALTAAALGLIAISVGRERRTTAFHPSKTPRQEEGREEGKAVAAAQIYALLYTFILSLLAFDLVMSLSPEWFSSLFGAYYFVGSFFGGLALLMILAVLARRKQEMRQIIMADHLHNLGKLMLGFTLVTGDFFFTQFLVIWYGNLPEETHFVIQRTQLHPWSAVAWTVLAFAFVVPFLVLLNRNIKTRFLPMLILSSVILCGLWLDKFLLIAPSLWSGEGLPLGLAEAMITLGFLGIMALCILFFLNRFYRLPYGDHLFHYGLARLTEKKEKM
jgi:Ni/Fe-hydrogenase subunit HybB-like protein